MGEITAALTIEVAAASKTAIAAIEKAGGSVVVLQRRSRLREAQA